MLIRSDGQLKIASKCGYSRQPPLLTTCFLHLDRVETQISCLKSKTTSTTSSTMSESKNSNSTEATIIKHMNTVRQDSLSFYLQVYNNVPASDTKSVRLEDVTLNDLLITAAGTRYTVAINPPMNSLSDARPRLIAMHKECLSRLGLSDIVINEYRLPRGGQAVAFVLCASFYILSARRSNFLPGSVVYDSLLHKVPSIAGYCYDHHPVAFLAFLGVHSMEAVLLAVKRLRVHRVPFLSGVWWAWVISTVIEGMTAFQRIDGMVKEQREQKKE